MGRSEKNVILMIPLFRESPATPSAYVSGIVKSSTSSSTGRGRRGAGFAINADETLVAGTYIDGTGGKDYGSERVNPPGMSGPLVQPLNKAKMMEERLAAHLPLVLFVADLKTGKVTELLDVRRRNFCAIGKGKFKRG